jgi:arylsulfatase A-like enzyme
MTLDRRGFLLNTLVTPLLAATKKKAVAPPNIIVIQARDIGSYMLGCYGNTEIHTPNIDRLAQLGVRFTASFATAPVSSAASDPVPSNALAPAGYHQTTGTEFPAQAPAQPFVVSISWPSPMTETAPQKNIDLYAASNFEAIGREEVATAEQIATLHKYAAGVTTIDDRMRALHEKLRDANLADNTLLIFTSSNGYLLGQHGLWGDGLASGSVNMYEEVVRIPTIWTFPALFPPQTSSNQVVGASDLAATLCELTGAPGGEGGYLPFVRGERLPKKRTWAGIAVARFRDTAMVRDYRYKLVVHEKDKSANQLFDISVDPKENSNLYENPQYVSVRDHLASELTASGKSA